jgi:hypothetical protein
MIPWKNLGFGALAISVAAFVAAGALTMKPVSKPPPLTEPPSLPAERPPTQTGPVFPRGVVLVTIPDPTSSTLTTYTTSFLGKSADLVELLAKQPGQGEVIVLVHPVGAEGPNPRNTALAFRLPPNAEQPWRRETKPRPAKPEFEQVCRNDFDRNRCIQRSTDEYKRKLDEAVADEKAAQTEYEAALANFDTQMAAAASQAASWAEQIRALTLSDSRCSNVAGAIQLATRELQGLTSSDATRLLVVQTDAEQNCGNESTERQTGVFVAATVLFFDCQDSCQTREAWMRSTLVNAGAPVAGIRIFEPGPSQLLLPSQMLEVPQ